MIFEEMVYDQNVYQLNTLNKYCCSAKKMLSILNGRVLNMVVLNLLWVVSVTLPKLNLTMLYLSFYVPKTNTCQNIVFCSNKTYSLKKHGTERISEEVEDK